MKGPDLFAISAFVLLGFTFLIRFINANALGISVDWHGTGYVIPPEAISVAMATLSCFCATAYSLWMLPFNREAMLLHFWLTAIGLAVFWFSFLASSLTESRSNIAVWAVFLVPFAVLFASNLRGESLSSNRQYATSAQLTLSGGMRRPVSDGMLTHHAAGASTVMV